MTVQAKIEARIARQSVATLKDAAAKLFADTREGSEIVFSFVIAALERQMPEAEFVAFCEAM